MRGIKCLAVLGLVAGLGSTSLEAQKAPDLSGVWVLQIDKSDFGPLPPVESRTDSVDHKDPKLIIKRAVSAGGQLNVTTLTYGIDGKPYTNKVGPNEVTSTLHWEGAVLVSVSSVPNPEGQITITDRYEVSADGKTLTQRRTLSIQGQEAIQTFVLAKQ